MTKIDMTQIFGDFTDTLPDGQEGLTMVFSPTSVPLKQRWRNNGLSADFMADYFATFFPGSEEANCETVTQEQVKSAVSFIANELLENAMKFNDESLPQPISIRLQMDSHRLVFLATNSVHPQRAKQFQQFIQELTTSDPSELYLCHLEKDPEDTNENLSGLGLLTMINDYQAKLGWKFEMVDQNPDEIAVTTMVQLTV
ncbi:DUF6272 family protein [Allocoleopsis franciscana]|uniref:ATP-binding protein n=1 Tax=Allocoleopsis franciscana PCC 7113 TaxID=1173027 RepID=K9WA08_9CYAN|nr:DUF6272 family protein [Allocoleopsis franciscana]AFZ16646.1 hypothetical protein Mic7113_0734 [Allocoleopsis franciscana PCC 7113]